MNLALLLPAGLAALAALLLPLLIHLARRSEHRPTLFAALRWLHAQPRPRHRLRLDDWPLLLVRLLLLALLALLLAQPVLLGRQDRRARIAVAPGIEPARAHAALGGDADAQWLWLAPGFPSLDTPMPAAPTDQASLLRELDAQLPAAAPLSVLVPRQWGLLDGQVPVLSRTVRWQVLEGRSPVPAAAGEAAPTLQVYAADPAALRYLRAVQAAWQPEAARLPAAAGDTVAVAAPTRPNAVAVWLAATPAPAPLLQWTRQGGRLLLGRSSPAPADAGLQPRWFDRQGHSVIDASAYGRGQLLRFARPLDPAVLPELLDADFPERLQAALQPPRSPSLADADSQRPLTGAAAPAPPAQPLAPWLALAIALLFLLERGLACAPRRAGAA